MKSFLKVFTIFLSLSKGKEYEVLCPWTRITNWSGSQTWNRWAVENGMVGWLWNYHESTPLVTRHSSSVPSIRHFQVANKNKKSIFSGMGNCWGKLPPAKHDRHFWSALPGEIAARGRVHQGLRQEQPGGPCLCPLQGWTDEECHACSMLPHGGKNMCLLLLPSW